MHKTKPNDSMLEKLVAEDCIAPKNIPYVGQNNATNYFFF